MQISLETTATVETNRQLVLDDEIPESFSKKVRVIVMPDDDMDEKAWLTALSRNEVFEFLADEEEDIYTVNDGIPFR